MSTGPVLKYLHLNTHWTFEFSHFRHGDGSEKVWQVLIHSPNYQFKHQTFSSIELRNVAIKKGNPTIKKRGLKDWKGMSESDSGYLFIYEKQWGYSRRLADNPCFESDVTTATYAATVTSCVPSCFETVSLYGKMLLEGSDLIRAHRRFSVS